MIALRPDRIALYGYAHMPSCSRRSARSTAATCPTRTTKLALLQLAIDG